MAEVIITNAMGPDGKVALDNECTSAITKMDEFKQAVEGVITQIEGVINGLKSDYTGEGSVNFYEACNSNIAQMRTMLSKIHEAYASDTGLFKSIEGQILTANESLTQSLKNTNLRFVAKSE